MSQINVKRGNTIAQYKKGLGCELPVEFEKFFDFLLVI